MENKYTSLRNLVSKYRCHPEFRMRVTYLVYKWAKDDTLSLKDFAFLLKKALHYLNKWPWINKTQ